MEELMKQILGDSYKEDMTQEEIQAFFKNQVLGDGKYVNKDMAEAEKKKLQDALSAKDLELQAKMTDAEKKDAADKALQEKIEALQKELLEGKLNQSEYKAMSITAKARLNAGVEDTDKEFEEFIGAISTDDEAKTSKMANYINKIVEKAYEKGKSDATKNKLGQMGNFKAGEGNNADGKTEAVERAERLAKMGNIQTKNSYFY